jgi:Xaa-Pro aminopeptidase
MVLCVESYIGEPNGREGVKLENEYLVTADGVENLTPYPFDDRLLGSVD